MDSFLGFFLRLLWANAFAVLLTFAAPADAGSWKARGVEAYKTGHFAEAASYFEKILTADEHDREAHLYLAYCYWNQYMGARNSPEGERLARGVERELRKVEELFPEEADTAATSLGNFLQMRAQLESDATLRPVRIESARAQWKKVAGSDPDNKEAFFNLAVLDWSSCYPQVMRELAQLQISPASAGPIPDAAVRKQMQTLCGSGLDNALQNLGIALAIDPGYAGALSYRGTILRLKALLADSREQSASLSTEAEQWERKALEAQTRRKLQPEPE